MMIFRIPPTSSRLHLGFTQPHASLTNPPYLLPTDKWACLPQGGEGQREGSKTMKSWIKYGLAGALILVASFWGGSVRAAEVCSTQGGPCPPVSLPPLYQLAANG